MEAETDSLVETITEAKKASQRLLNRSNGATRYRRSELYDDAVKKAEKAKEAAEKKALEVIKEEMETLEPYESAEDFLRNDGWMANDNVPSVVTDHCEALYGAASAVSELEYVEMESFDRSRPYESAGDCAMNSLDNALERLED